MTLPLPPEFLLLRAATRGLVDPDQRPPAAWPPDLDWQLIPWLGQWHGVLPTLHACATPAASPLPVARLQRALAESDESNRLSLLGRLGEARLLAEKFRAAGLDVLLTSGWALGVRFLRCPEARQVDRSLGFLVAAPELERARQVARDGGYEVTPDPLRLHVPGRSLLALRTPEPALKIGFGPSAPEISVAGARVRVPSAEDWLLLRTGTGALPRVRELRRAADVVALTHQVRDWEDVVARARAAQRWRALGFVVLASHALLDLAPPEHAVAALADTGVRQLVEPFVRDAVHQPTRAIPRFESARREFALGDTPAQRLRTAARHVRRTLFPRTDRNESLGRFAPTPQGVVNELIAFAEVGPDDVLIDLGCGDGRIVLAAARAGARGIGVDSDPARIAEARAAAASAPASSPGRVEWRCADVGQVDVRDASVVTIYLQEFAYPRLRRQLLRQLRPGARIVSHDFIFPGWPPERSAIVRAGAAKCAVLHLWRVPPRV
jgi:methylase of polypeptide subunit release factors